EERSCFCAFQGSPAQAPEFAVSYHYSPNLTQATWTYTASNRLLFEAGMSYGSNSSEKTPTGDVLPTDISIVDQGLGLSYGAAAGGSLTSGALYAKGNYSDPLYSRFSASYVTGSHAFKIGMTELEGWHDQNAYTNQSVQYVFLNRRPTSVNEYADPFTEDVRV